MDIAVADIRQLLTDVAREELLPRFTRVERLQKADGSILTEADLAVQKRIVQSLLAMYPDTVVLGEEMSEHEQLQCLDSGKPVWCLDPIDGTNNFSSGIPYFSMSLALIQRGEVELALVYDPMRDELFMTQRGHGASLNGEPLTLISPRLALKQCIAIVDFKRLNPSLATRLVSHCPYSSQRSFGSVALDWCWLAAGRGHIYLHGGANLWDYVAGLAIFEAAGGVSMTLEGEPIYIPRLLKRSLVAAADQALLDEWTRFLSDE
jgi:myo-inositol-1(or 4)-monophosphatase